MPREHTTRADSGQSSDYSGRRHARATKSMLLLPPAVLKVLLELRYHLADGESRHISQDTIRRATRLSEATVSTAMRLLAGESVTIGRQTRQAPAWRFIERTWYDDKGDGRAGYVITMLPPPELRAADGRRQATGPCRQRPPAAAELEQVDEHPAEPAEQVDEHDEGSPDDPIERPPIGPVLTPKSAAHEGSCSDPTSLHAHAQQQQRRDRLGATSSTRRPPEIYTDSTWRAMLSGTPGYSAARFAADRALLHERGDRYGIGVIVRARSCGEPIYSAKKGYHHAQTDQAGGTGARHPDRHGGRRDAPRAAEQLAAAPFIDPAALGL